MNTVAELKERLKPIDPIDEALAYQKFLDDGWTLEGLANEVGTPAWSIKQKLGLLKLTEQVQGLVKVGHLPLEFALLMTKLDVLHQRLALRLLVERSGVSLAIFREHVIRLEMEQGQVSMFDFLNGEISWKILDNSLRLATW